MTAAGPRKTAIRETLWPAGMSARAGVWAILDAARDQRIFGAVDASYLDKCCLFAGDLPWQLQMTAPYLAQLKPEDRLTRTILDQGWGQSWGVFLRTETDLKTLRRHFRGFLRVRDQRGRRLLFRYYDPRVMRVYLPTCTPEELRTVFGPVEEYAMENEDGSAILRFRFDGQKLVQSKLEV